MTVFEQHVDLHQVATEPTFLGFVLIFLVGLIIFFVGLRLTIKFAKGGYKRFNRNWINPLRHRFFCGNGYSINCK